MLNRGRDVNGKRANFLEDREDSIKGKLKEKAKKVSKGEESINKKVPEKLKTGGREEVKGRKGTTGWHRRQT